MRFKIICLALIILSCGQSKNKVYENVNIIREEKAPAAKKVDEFNFPMEFGKSEMLIFEVDKSDIHISSWEKDSIYLDNTFKKAKSEDIEVYEGNKQLVVKEKGRKDQFRGNTWRVYVPAYINLTLRSQNGDVIVENIKGTFNINSPVGNVSLEDCSSAMQVLSQSGDIEVKNWEQMGRSKLSTASGSLKIRYKSDLAYNLNAHAGSDMLELLLSGNELKSNLEIITFKDQGKVISDFTFTSEEEFYSDAVERQYDSRKIFLNSSFPESILSTGTGTIQLEK